MLSSRPGTLSSLDPSSVGSVVVGSSFLQVLSAVETKVPGYYEKMKDEVNLVVWDFFLRGFFKDEVEKYTS